MAVGSMGLPGVAMAAHAGGGGSVASRIALVAIAVAAVAAFTVLQVRARSGRRRPADEAGRGCPPDVPGRQTPSPGYQDGSEDDDAADGDEALFANHGAFWGFLSVPGYRGAPQLPRYAPSPEGTRPSG